MARTDIAGLLTGIGQAPIDPMQGGSIAEREMALQQQALKGLRQSVGALTGGRVDARTTMEKAQDALAQLDPNKREDRQKILQIVSRVSPERVPALQQAFAERDRQEAKEAREIASSEELSRLRASQEARAVSAERRAVEAAEREEERLQAETDRDNLVRQTFLDIAVEEGDQKMVKLIAAGLPLKEIQSQMFSGSDAVVKPLTSDDREAFNSLLETATFQTLVQENMEDPAIFKVGLLSDAVETGLFQRAKQLVSKKGMSNSAALKQAIMEAAENFPKQSKGGDSAKQRGAGAKTTGTGGAGQPFDASGVKIDSK